MESDGIKKTSKAALLAALTFVITMTIHFPLPGVGYVHPGDVIVLLCGAFVGPLHAFLAAGIGSALADLALGYVVYMPATFVIKGLAALFATLIFRRNMRMSRFVLGGFVGAVVIVAGYLSFETVLYGFPTALTSVLPNTAQVLFGILVAAIFKSQVGTGKS